METIKTIDTSQDGLIDKNELNAAIREWWILSNTEKRILIKNDINSHLWKALRDALQNKVDEIYMQDSFSSTEIAHITVWQQLYQEETTGSEQEIKIRETIKKRNIDVRSKIASFNEWIWDFIDNPDKLKIFILKNNWMERYLEKVNEASSKEEKQCLVINILLSYHTQWEFFTDIFNDFNRDTINLIQKYQNENAIDSDAILWPKTWWLLHKKNETIQKEHQNMITNGLKLDDGNIIKQIEKTPYHECAEYVINYMKKNLNTLLPSNLYSDINWVIGNARTMLNNIQRLWKVNYNIFPKNKPELNSASDIVQYIEGLLAKQTTPPNKEIDKGDIVWLFYPPSSNHEKAYRESAWNTFNTHVGFVIGKTTEWIPIVSHNIHGTIYNQPITDLQNTNNITKCAVTRIWSPIARYAKEDKQEDPNYLLS